MVSKAVKMLVAVVLVVGTVMAGGLAIAAIPGPGGSITACYTSYAGLFEPRGALRVVENATDCGRSEGVLRWNQQGVPGPAGPPSPPAPPAAYSASGSGEEGGHENRPGLVTLDLPAGTFAVTATGDLRLDTSSGAPTRVYCTILPPNPDQPPSPVTRGFAAMTVTLEPGHEEAAAMSGIVTLPQAAIVELRCWSDGALTHWHLTAIRVSPSS